jgi:hypothetical protein
LSKDVGTGKFYAARDQRTKTSAAARVLAAGSGVPNRRAALLLVIEGFTMLAADPGNPGRCEGRSL